MDLSKVYDFYKNKTSKYLVYSLFEHHPTMPHILKGLNIKAFGISDFYINNEDSIYDPFIYALCSINGKTKNQDYAGIKFYRQRFYSNLQFLRSTSFIDSDYEFIQIPDHHMIIFKIPENKKGIKKLFLDGQYSKLYSLEEQERYSISQQIIKIMNKSEDYLPKYLEELNKKYNGIDLTISDIKTHKEFDIAPVLSEEVFNFDLLNT